jgi:hypothetical protein
MPAEPPGNIEKSLCTSLQHRMTDCSATWLEGDLWRGPFRGGKSASEFDVGVRHAEQSLHLDGSFRRRGSGATPCSGTLAGKTAKEPREVRLIR